MLGCAFGGIERFSRPRHEKPAISRWLGHAAPNRHQQAGTSQVIQLVPDARRAALEYRGQVGSACERDSEFNGTRPAELRSFGFGCRFFRISTNGTWLLCRARWRESVWQLDRDTWRSTARQSQPLKSQGPRWCLAACRQPLSIQLCKTFMPLCLVEACLLVALNGCARGDRCVHRGRGIRPPPELKGGGTNRAPVASE